MTTQIFAWGIFISVIIALLIIDLGILNKKDEVKISRVEAANNCATKSKSKPSEVRSQFYKDCMQDLGY